jgi:hypothetical protein
MERTNKKLIAVVGATGQQGVHGPLSGVRHIKMSTVATVG